MVVEHKAAGHMAFAVRKQSDGYWCSTHCLPFKSLAYGLMLPTLKVFLPNLVKLFWEHPPRHQYMCLHSDFKCSHSNGEG